MVVLLHQDGFRDPSTTDQFVPGLLLPFADSQLNFPKRSVLIEHLRELLTSDRFCYMTIDLDSSSCKRGHPIQYICVKFRPHSLW